ncbi:MAG: HAMP domain-containing histidine kinase [Burkholderiales bacterium]|nr:HAMP domain-containing histidine kinase [Burkholderiales bacterium]
MHAFLLNNRDELIARCKLKVAQRPKRGATTQQLSNGIPLFLDQLTRTLAAEEADETAESLRISGPSGGDSLALSEMGVTDTAHGKDLMRLGYSVDQVVHDYGDLCQAITELAFERDAPFAVQEFRTLNRCLDNAIADAVTEFGFQREAELARRQDAEGNRRAGFLAHELRNSLSTATISLRALELSGMPVSGATGALLKRSLTAMGNLITRAIDQVRNGALDQRETFSVAALIADAHNEWEPRAAAGGLAFEVPVVDPALAVRGDRELLLAALGNLLQNALKFTHAHSEVTSKAYAFGEMVLIDVIDHCGGLPPGRAEGMFTPFTQRNEDRSGLGLGLSIARSSVEADAGTLGVRDVPGIGCVFTISLPRMTSPAA